MTRRVGLVVAKSNVGKSLFGQNRVIAARTNGTGAGWIPRRPLVPL